MYIVNIDIDKNIDRVRSAIEQCVYGGKSAWDDDWGGGPMFGQWGTAQHAVMGILNTPIYTEYKPTNPFTTNNIHPSHSTDIPDHVIIHFRETWFRKYVNLKEREMANEFPRQLLKFCQNL